MLQGFPESQSASLGKAALPGVYRNLTDFVILTIQEKEQIIASEREAALFFEAMIHPGKPNEALKDALTDYNAFISDFK